MALSRLVGKLEDCRVESDNDKVIAPVNDTVIETDNDRIVESGNDMIVEADNDIQCIKKALALRASAFFVRLANC